MDSLLSLSLGWEATDVRYHMEDDIHVVYRRTSLQELAAALDQPLERLFVIHILLKMSQDISARHTSRVKRR